MTHIPYKGTAPVMTDLIASHVDLTFIQFSAFYEMHRAGKARILAVAADKRVDALPDVPSMAEIGYPKIVSNTWNMVAAPPKTPNDILEKINQAINDVLQMPDVRAKFASINTTVEGGDLQRARSYVAEDRAKWKAVIKAAGIQPE
jgi:tripartite-type tricarboxylate transporter receptor subunit TctC